MSILADKMVAVARGELGYCEKKTNSNLDSKTGNAGYGNYTKYGKWFEGGWSNGQPWCNVFVCWCANQIGVYKTLVPSSASCGKTRDWFKSKGLWKARTSGYTPKPGDLIIFSNTANSQTTAHIGIVEKVANGRVYTIEGNTGGGSSTVVDNGGQVASKNYALTYNKIIGYCAVAYPSDTTVSNIAKEEKYVPTKVNMKLNGKKVAVTSIVHEQENYVRLRDLPQLGLKVDYDKAAGLPTIDLAEVETLKMRVEGKNISVPNVIVGNTNYAGVRAFMEALGYTVDWDSQENVVICSK